MMAADQHVGGLQTSNINQFGALEDMCLGLKYSIIGGIQLDSW
jgi:hypothetical protein